MAITDIRSNRPELPSDWNPNLRGRDDVPKVVVDALDRVRQDLQQLHAKTAKVEQVATAARDTAAQPQPVLNSFIELSIGSPTDGGSGAVRIRVGRGTPEGIVEGSAYKDIWLRTDAAGITTFLYVKTTEGKTGWVAAAL